MNKPNDMVYIVTISPLTQHPQKCRIGVCHGYPILKEGEELYSSMKGGDAETVYEELAECLNDIKASNYDAVNDAWMIPHRVLDRWMTSSAELLQLRHPSHKAMTHFKYY